MRSLSYTTTSPSLTREGDKGGGLLSQYLGGEVDMRNKLGNLGWLGFLGFLGFLGGGEPNLYYLFFLFFLFFLGFIPKKSKG